MGFLDRFFGGGGESPKKEESKSAPEAVVPQVTKPNVPESIPSIPDYIYNPRAGSEIVPRAILHVPMDKVRKIGGRDGLRRIFLEVYKGSDPAWGEDMGSAYGIEVPIRDEFWPDADWMLEELKRKVDERAQQS